MNGLKKKSIWIPERQGCSGIQCLSARDQDLHLLKPDERDIPDVFFLAWN